MKESRDLIEYNRQVEAGETALDHTLAYSLQAITRRLYVWFNEEEYQKASRLDKLIYFSTGISMFLLWTLVAIGVRSQEFNMDNIVEICQTISVVIGGIVTFSKYCANLYNRKLMSETISVLDDKVRLARTTASEELRALNVFQYLVLSKVTMAAVVMGKCVTMSLMVFAIITGEPIFQAELPFERPTYSAIWWTDQFVTQAIMWLCSFLSSIIDGIYLDCIFQVTFLYRAQYEQLLTLGKSDETDHAKFVTGVEELVQLKE